MKRKRLNISFVRVPNFIIRTLPPSERAPIAMIFTVFICTFIAGAISASSLQVGFEKGLLSLLTGGELLSLCVHKDGNYLPGCQFKNIHSLFPIVPISHIPPFKAYRKKCFRSMQICDIVGRTLKIWRFYRIRNKN